MTCPKCGADDFACEYGGYSKCNETGYTQEWLDLTCRKCGEQWQEDT